MKRLRPGDLVVFYSPKLRFQGKEPLKKFTAIARVKEGEVYEGDMGGGLRSYRRDADYLPCNEVDALPLIPELSFIRNKQAWGYVFRFGLLEVPKQDFETISRKMTKEG